MSQADLFDGPKYLQSWNSIVPRDHRGNARPSIEHARAEANEGMRLAIDNAGSEWADIAYRFLLEFLKQRTYFKSEDVSNASKLAGMKQPKTDRAWGSLYVRAQKAGLMVQDGTERSNRRHASICPRWRSLLR